MVKRFHLWKLLRAILTQRNSFREQLYMKMMFHDPNVSRLRRQVFHNLKIFVKHRKTQNFAKSVKNRADFYNIHQK